MEALVRIQSRLIIEPTPHALQVGLSPFAKYSILARDGYLPSGGSFPPCIRLSCWLWSTVTIEKHKCKLKTCLKVSGKLGNVKLILPPLRGSRFPSNVGSRSDNKISSIPKVVLILVLEISFCRAWHKREGEWCLPIIARRRRQIKLLLCTNEFLS